jgi:hypothetical protein
MLAVAAALIVAVVVTNSARHGHKPPKPTAPSQSRVAISHLRQHVLGVTGSWDLFARGVSYLIRIQFASGTITRTSVPPLQSNNPEVALLVGPHEIIVRSYDQVPGYVVPDGDPASTLTGPLAADGPGPLLPGPLASQAWILVSSPGREKLALVDLDGRATGTSIRMPGGGALPATAISDGRGYVLLLTSANRIYDAGPTWDRIVPTMAVAVGPTGWLSLACHDGRCRDVVTSAASGAQRTLPGRGLQDSAFTWPTLGTISPDGTIAAVPVFFGNRSGSGVTIRLVNLRGGTTRSLHVALNPAPGYQFMAWSPDSRWLFVVAENGRIVAVSARTGQATGLGLPLPPVSQIAVRS